MSSQLPNDSDYLHTRNLIISASAGSGKTTSLTHRLVQLLLSDRIPHNNLRNILAVTFTNNAALEMKQRTLQLLRGLALGDPTILAAVRPLVTMEESQLRRRAESLVERILDNYSDFQVQTIDSFLVRVFKASAIEFGFPPDFKIVIGSQSLLDEAFELFARDLADGSERTPLILDLIHLLDWIRGDQKRFLWNPYDDLSRQVKRLYATILNTARPLAVEEKETELHALTEEAIAALRKLNDAILQVGLEPSASFKKYMATVSSHKLEKLLDLPVRIYNRGKMKKEEFERASLRLEPLVGEVKSLLSDVAFLRAYVFFQPYLRTHRLLAETLDNVKRQRGELDLADAAYKLAQEIDSGIVPEIYYNLGETIYHYLIDEVQDTGPVQWFNLRPLIENALGVGGSLFAVGDIKQSIYGFRGGDWRIMKKLMEGKEFPSAPVQPITLQQNWRSGQHILEFTRKVFHEVVPVRITDGAANLTGLQTFVQEPIESLKGKGYVEQHFIAGDTDTRPERDHILTIVGDCLMRGYNYSDIAILTPENEDVVKVSGWLNEAGIPFIPFSTLDIRTRKVIGEILSLLRFLDSPVDDLAFATFLLGEIFNRRLVMDGRSLRTEQMRQLLFLWKQSGSHHPLYTELRRTHPDEWKAYLEDPFGLVGYLPLYDLTVYLLKHLDVFTLFPEEEAALVKLLEVVKTFEERGENSLREFVRYTSNEGEGEDWTMNVPPSVNAVKIMTVHKAKGLGFPVVIVLLYDTNLRHDNVHVDQTGEKVRLLRVVKDDAVHQSLDSQWREKMLNARVDQLNKLYVALTRAKDEMYVLSVRYTGKSEPSAFLPDQEFQGGEKSVVRQKSETEEQVALLHYHNAPWRRSVQRPWGIRRQETKRGELLHRVLARIEFLQGDVESILQSAMAMETEDDEFDYDELKNTLKKFLEEEAVASYFRKNDHRIVMNEQEFAHRSGRLLRMDRVVVDEDLVTVIDYKTGKEHPDYADQVREYMQVLRDLHPTRRIDGVLAYIDLNIVRSVA